MNQAVSPVHLKDAFSHAKIPAVAKRLHQRPADRRIAAVVFAQQSESGLRQQFQFPADRNAARDECRGRHFGWPQESSATVAVAQILEYICPQWGYNHPTHEFDWDGKDSNGNQLEDGAYQIVVSTKVPSGETEATVTTTVFGKVTGVASDSNNIYIGLGDAVTATLGDIVTMRDDNYFDKNNSSNVGNGEDSGDKGEETPEEDVENKPSEETNLA